MEKPDPVEIAKMLRKPEGEFGLQVAEKMNDSNKEMIEWAVEKLDIRKGDSILEIGFGNGKHIKLILEFKEHLRYTGLDFSDSMMKIASDTYQREIESGKVSFFQGISSDMPFSPNSFDKIFTVNTLYFWHNPISDLQNILRVLKPGGVFCMSFRSKSYMLELPFTQYGFTLYEQHDAKDLLEQAGFAISDVQIKREVAQEWNGKTLYPENIFIVASK